MTKLTNAQSIYLKVLNKEISRFPTGFWTGAEGVKNSIECARYLVEDILEWDREDIKKSFSKSIVRKYKLGGVLQTIYNNSPFEFLNAVYPSSFNEWELSSVPKSYYADINNRRKVIDFLLSKINYNLSLFSSDLFRANKVDALLNHYYEGSLFRALEDVYPQKYKPWQLNYVPNGWWDVPEHCREATEWMLEQLMWDETEIKKCLSQETFKEFNLLSMLIYKYSGVPFYAINDLFPDTFKPWEFKSTPDFFWDSLANRIDTIEWILYKLQKSIVDVTYTDVKKLGLRAFLADRYDNKIDRLKTEYTHYKQKS